MFARRCSLVVRDRVTHREIFGKIFPPLRGLAVETDTHCLRRDLRAA